MARSEHPQPPYTRLVTTNNTSVMMIITRSSAEMRRLRIQSVNRAVALTLTCQADTICRLRILQVATDLGYLARCSRGIIEES